MEDRYHGSSPVRTITAFLRLINSVGWSGTDVPLLIGTPDANAPLAPRRIRFAAAYVVPTRAEADALI
ncbi:hypothetical protein RM704_23510 [Streptomyces sp. DSM 3412]|uniref:Uncharacterized protein n=1 Tax=Streptomyces gottesmaniae TaxID=3075518 RepID=A0ABU2Z2G3_9ACTN|nr:hypothetical protein [Streptomyces sp. DSM 3412]MDT0570396.1 hypothetical protein [Streptomyces sp. DSM 3412]